MTVSDDLTVGEALGRFRLANGLRADEAAMASWTCRIGPVELRLPNFAWRRRAILAHDLHHILTDYPCTLRGECQMAAWEFGAGRMPHRGAALFCLPLVAMGLFWSPLQIWRAFRDGRSSSSLHSAAAIDRLMDMPLASLRRNLANSGNERAMRFSFARFVILVLQGIVVASAPIVFLIGVLAGLIA